MDTIYLILSGYESAGLVAGWYSPAAPRCVAIFGEDRVELAENGRVKTRAFSQTELLDGLPLQQDPVDLGY